MDSRLQRSRSSSIACVVNHQPYAAAMVARPKPQNFHRIIHSNDTNQISIRIPNKFTREHRKSILLNNVSIVVSDDRVWSLGWMISGDGKLWLQEGWPEFAEHYCLKTGDLLLFNHHGKSVFHVRIFDQSSCEIKYALPTISPISEKEMDQPVIEDDQKVSEKEVTGEDDQCTAMSETEVLHAPSIFEEIKASEKKKEQRSRNRALESATSFKSDNPFFSVTISVSYRTWGLYVPRAFLRRSLMRSGGKCVNCVLRVSGGGNWGPVQCRRYNRYGRLLGGNWVKFRDDNHLGVGDVCVLELINEMKRVLKVTIFRAC